MVLCHFSPNFQKHRMTLGFGLSLSPHLDGLLVALHYVLKQLLLSEKCLLQTFELFRGVGPACPA